MTDEKPGDRARESTRLYRQIRTAANEALEAFAEDDYKTAIDKFKLAIGLTGYLRGLQQSPRDS